MEVITGPATSRPGMFESRSRPSYPRAVSNERLGNRFRLAAQPDGPESAVSSSDADRLKASIKAFAGAWLVVNTLSASAAVAYSADGSRSARDWKPRRHHRRFDDREHGVTLGPKTKEGDTAEHEQLWEAAEEESGGWGQTMSAYKEIAQQQARGFRDDVAKQFQRFSSADDPSAEVSSMQSGYTLQARNQASAPSPVRRVPRAIPRPQTGFGWAVVALLLAALSKAIFGWQLPRWLRGGQGRTKGGRWVQDRSLGGKLVFIPDDEVAPGKKQDPFGDWNVAATPSTPSAAAERAASGASASTSAPSAFAAGPQAAQQQSSASALPAWWDPPPVISSVGSFKAQATQEAQQLVRAMEEGKVAGRDPSLEQLVALRQTCAEMQITVKTRTPQGRDTLLRIAADGAISAAMDQNLLMLSGIQPKRFIAGIACDLGIPEEKAGRIATAAIAAQLSKVLQDTYTSIRAGREDDVLMPLLRIDALLRALPLAPGSAEAAMVGESVASRATLQERQRIFYMFGGMHRSSASAMAELLGFNPELVLPHLDQELGKTARNRSSSTPQR